MNRERGNFYVISGCSGGGKSSILQALREKGFPCVDEAGRTIVQEQLAIGGDATPWQDRAKFGELLLSRYMCLFDQVTERTRPVFFDRGIPEILGFSRMFDVPVPAPHLAAARIYRYAGTVFLTPPWPEIFHTDRERRHSYEDALEIYRMLPGLYRECGYELIEVPKLAVSQRADFILERVLGPG